MRNDQILRKPIVLTEKSNVLRAKNQVIFEVALEANKIQIRQAVQSLFNVKVVSVNTLIMRGKDRRMGRGYSKLQNWKKAIITLKEGDAIDFFGDNQSA